MKTKLIWMISLILIVSLVTLSFYLFYPKTDSDVCECGKNHTTTVTSSRVYYSYKFDVTDPNDDSVRIKGEKVSLFGKVIKDTKPDYKLNFDFPSESEKHWIKSNIDGITKIISITSISFFALFFISFIKPHRRDIIDGGSTTVYSDLYRIVYVHKKVSDKDGEFIEGKKIAICGITVRDDCPDEVFLGFPTYKKSRKMLEKHEGGGG